MDMCLLLLPYRINILRLGWVWFWQFAMEWRAATPIMRRQRTLRRSVASSKKQHFLVFSYVVVLKCDNDDIFENGRTHKLRSCVAENPSELLLEALVRATAGGNDIKQEISSDILYGYFGYFGYFGFFGYFFSLRNCRRQFLFADIQQAIHS